MISHFRVGKVESSKFVSFIKVLSDYFLQANNSIDFKIWNFYYYTWLQDAMCNKYLQAI